MRAIDYQAPTSLSEAVSIMAANGDRARPLAGGTDVLVQLRGGRREADVVVDTKKIPELNTLNLSDNGLQLGAAVACYRIYQDSAVAAAYPGLIDAAGLIGSIQIQGRATVGGNLCNAAPSGDTIPPVITLGGEAHINGPNGWRTMPAEDFCTGPGRNALENGELLVAIQLPAPAANSGTAYLRFIPRNRDGHRRGRRLLLGATRTPPARPSSRRASRWRPLGRRRFWPPPPATAWRGRPFPTRPSPKPAAWPAKPPHPSPTCAAPSASVTTWWTC